jgi:hypothetical protein
MCSNGIATVAKLAGRSRLLTPVGVLHRHRVGVRDSMSNKRLAFMRRAIDEYSDR